MVNCNFENFACGGGYLMTTIDYLQVDGLVSRECKPYLGVPKRCNYKCDDPAIEFQRYYCSIGSLKVMTKHQEIIDDLT